MIFQGVRNPLPPPPSGSALDFSTFPTLLWHVNFSTLPPPPPDDNFKIRAYMYNFTILHIMYMYIYHFLVSWNGREFDYWHTNRVGSVHSAAHTFYVTPTSQRACALAFMSPFSTVSGFYVTPAQRNWKSRRQLKFKRIRVYTHKTVVKGFVNLNNELSSIQAIKSAF